MHIWVEQNCHPNQVIHFLYNSHSILILVWPRTYELSKIVIQIRSYNSYTTLIQLSSSFDRAHEGWTKPSSKSGHSFLIQLSLNSHPRLTAHIWVEQNSHPNLFTPLSYNSHSRLTRPLSLGKDICLCSRIHFFTMFLKLRVCVVSLCTCTHPAS